MAASVFAFFQLMSYPRVLFGSAGRLSLFKAHNHAAATAGHTVADSPSNVRLCVPWLVGEGPVGGFLFLEEHFPCRRPALRSSVVTFACSFLSLGSPFNLSNVSAGNASCCGGACGRSLGGLYWAQRQRSHVKWQGHGELD